MAKFMLRQFSRRYRLAAAALAAVFLIVHPVEAQQEDRLREAQHAMMLLGYYSGRVDGQVSQKTVESLARFQRESGLAASGKLDDRTLAALRGKRDALGNSLSLPPVGGGTSGSAPQAAYPKLSTAPQIPVESHGGSATRIQGMVAVPGREQATTSIQAAPPAPVHQVERLAGSIDAPPPTSGQQAGDFDWSTLMWGVVAAAAGLFAWLGWLWSGIGVGRRRAANPYLQRVMPADALERRREPKL